MPGACRLGDKAKAKIDAHGCPACPHTDVQGPAIAGSGDVRINGMPALRVGDPGIHAACCTTNTWNVLQGSGQVFVNKKPLVRQGDQTRHCGGIGAMDTASGNVVDGSPAGSASMLAELKPQLAEWLARVQSNGITDLVSLGSLRAGAAMWAVGEAQKLNDPDCRGADYLNHLAKCLPSKPPLPDPPGPGGPSGPPRGAPARRSRFHDQAIEPVGVLDLDNPITAIVTLPVGGVVRGAQLGVKGVAIGGKALGGAGKWAGGKLLDGGKLLGGLVG